MEPTPTRLRRICTGTLAAAGGALTFLLMSSCNGQSSSGPLSFLLAPETVAGAQQAFVNAINDPAMLPPTVHPQQPAQSNADSSVPIRGIIAMDSATIGRGSDIRADISVLGRCYEGDDRHHRSHHDHDCAFRPGLKLERSVIVASNQTVRADTIRLERNARIQGTAEYNHLQEERHAFVANRITPLAALPLLPPFLTGEPGHQNIGGQHGPLAPGQYGRAVVPRRHALELSGGFYHFRSLSLGRGSSMVCKSTCVVLVKETLATDRGATLAAVSGKSNDLIVYVEGDAHYHHNSGRQDPASVRLGDTSRVTADIYAWNGRLLVQRGSHVRGNLAARKVEVGPGSLVISGEAVKAQVAQLIQAGVGGVVEIPGEIRLEIPACALSEDTVISIAQGPEIVPVEPITPEGFVTRGPGYDLGPNGLTFHCPVTLLQNYRPADFSGTGVNLADLRIYTAALGSPFVSAPGSVDTTAHVVQGAIEHFSISIIGVASGSAGSVLPVTLEVIGNQVFGTYYSSPASTNRIALGIFDATVPSAPYELGSYNLNGFGGSGIQISGNIAYMVAHPAAGSIQLLALDISNPGVPPVLGSAAPPTNHGGNNLVISGDRAYSACASSVTGQMHICIYNISNPTAPSFVGESPGFAPGSYSFGIAVSGNLLFVSTSFGNSSVYSFDISNPDNPLALDSYTLGSISGPPMALRIDGNRIYVNHGSEIQILTFDGAGSLAPAGVFQLSGARFMSVDAVGNRAVAITQGGTGELIVLNVSDPTNIIELERFTLNWPSAVRLIGSRAYVLQRAATNLVILETGAPGPTLSTVSYSTTIDLASLPGPAISATDEVLDMDTDNAGNLYVSYRLNQTDSRLISVFDSSGTYQYQFTQPQLAGSNDLGKNPIFLDRTQSRVYELSTDGLTLATYSSLTGTFGGTLGSVTNVPPGRIPAFQLDFLRSNGVFWFLADNDNTVSNTGFVLSFDDSGNLLADFNVPAIGFPYDIDVSQTTGRLYISDLYANQIVAYDFNGVQRQTLNAPGAGVYGTGSITVSDGDNVIFSVIGDSSSPSSLGVTAYDLAGNNLLTFHGTDVGAPADFTIPVSMTYSENTRKLYVLSADTRKVHVFNVSF